MAARNRRYDRGAGVQRVDRPVISIGNISTGGTGKTPMVAWIARQLMEAGAEPVIAMRGYAARPGEMSDEQAEYRQVLPDPHVVANPDRATALREFLTEHADVRCVILDDGFQHRQLHRDLDLGLIDATAGTFGDRLLPVGNLREPLEGLARADAVIVTHAGQRDERLEQEIVRHHGVPPIAWARHEWEGLLGLESDGRPGRPLDLDWLRGARVLTMLGIGKPQSVIEQIEAHGATVAVNIPARDHERYDRQKLTIARGLCGGCDAMVVTLKDWVKIRDRIAKSRENPWPCPIIVPALAIQVIDGEAALRRMVLDAVIRGGRGNGGVAR